MQPVNNSACYGRLAPYSITDITSKLAYSGSVISGAHQHQLLH